MSSEIRVKSMAPEPLTVYAILFLCNIFDPKSNFLNIPSIVYKKQLYVFLKYFLFKNILK